MEGLCELLGGHRQVETLTRAEFNTLRDHLRSYPKNRHRLRATRNQPLSKIISDGKFEPINPRTAKKFFELARALVTYAHDRSEEHTSELQSLMRISYAVFCLKKTTNQKSKN